MTSDEREQMDRLCERIQIEKEPHAFTKLVEQLNELLERAHHRIDSERP
jgi:hypothetical protein